MLISFKPITAPTNEEKKIRRKIVYFGEMEFKMPVGQAFWIDVPSDQIYMKAIV